VAELVARLRTRLRARRVQVEHIGASLGDE